DPDADVREASGRALGAIGPDAKEAAPTLMKLLTGEKEPAEVRIGAAAGLVGIGGRGKKENRGVDVLGKEFLEKGKTPAEVRRKAIEVLDEMEEDAAPAAPALVKILKDNNAGIRVRVAAATALGALGSEKGVVRTLAGALKDANPWVRHAAAYSLADIGP